MHKCTFCISRSVPTALRGDTCYGIMTDGVVSFISTDEATSSFSLSNTPVVWSPVSQVLFLCSCLNKTAHYSQGMISADGSYA